MNDILLTEIVFFSLIPAVFMSIGGFIGSIYTLGDKAKSITQHFVSGIVFSAVAVDLLPQILATKSPFTVGGGFLAGTIVMLLLMQLTHVLEHDEHGHEAVRPPTEVKNNSALPMGLLSAVFIDVFVDGILIGISFLGGEESGMLITIALSTCVFFLGMATSAILKDRAVSAINRIFYTLVLACSMPLGAWAGSAIVSHLPAAWFTEVLAFGIAALLYLGAEELLVEAHKIEDSPWITSAFFFGFLAILLLKL